MRPLKLIKETENNNNSGTMSSCKRFKFLFLLLRLLIIVVCLVVTLPLSKGSDEPLVNSTDKELPELRPEPEFELHDENSRSNSNNNNNSQDDGEFSGGVDYYEEAHFGKPPGRGTTNDNPEPEQLWQGM